MSLPSKHNKGILSCIVWMIGLTTACEFNSCIQFGWSDFQTNAMIANWMILCFWSLTALLLRYLIRRRMVKASWSFSSSLKPTISCLWLSFAVKNPLIRVIVKCVSENFLSLISIRPRLISSQPFLLSAFILMLVQKPRSMRTFNSSKGRKRERVKEKRVIKEEKGNETQRMNEIK